MVATGSIKSTLILILASKAFDGVHGFVQPKAFANSGIGCRSFPIDVVDAATSSPNLNMLPDVLSTAASIVLSDEVDAITEANSGLQGMRTFFVIITALVFGFAGLTYATAAFIVPKATDRLEKDTKRLRPGLWDEYEAKLVEGETMANRPDLLQELGNLMQPIIIADFEESAEAQKGKLGGKDAKVDTKIQTKKEKKKAQKKKDKEDKDKKDVDDRSRSEEVVDEDSAISECLLLSGIDFFL